jgi:hypothetical protein
MTYKLFRLEGSKYVETSFDDLDNKAFWCNLGNKKEEAFVAFVREKTLPGYSIQIHPEKRTNPYHPDLLVNNNHIGEVKIKNSPLFMARRYGVNPQYALTMDLKDSFNYCRWLARRVDIKVFLWVKWEAHKMEWNGSVYSVEPMEGVWVVDFSKLRKWELRFPPPIHWYKEKFRQPRSYAQDEWARELVEFDERLKVGTNQARNITSNGYILHNDIRYPKGHSSGSYVFDLSDGNLFHKLV